MTSSSETGRSIWGVQESERPPLSDDGGGSSCSQTPLIPSSPVSSAPPGFPPLAEAWLRTPLECGLRSMRTTQASMEADMNRLTTFIDKIDRRIPWLSTTGDPRPAKRRAGGEREEKDKSGEGGENFSPRSGTGRSSRLNSVVDNPMTNASNTQTEIEGPRSRCTSIGGKIDLLRGLTIGDMTDEGIEDILHEATQNIERACDFFRKVKNKLPSGESVASKHFKRCNMRLGVLRKEPDILDSQNGPFTSSSDFFCYYSRTLDCILYEWLARTGLRESASLLCSQENLQDLVDSEVYQQMDDIIEALRKRDLGPALLWCSANKVRLQNVQSSFEIQLHLQEILERVKNEDLNGAVGYVHAHLSPADFKTCEEMKKVLTLIAFQDNAPYSYQSLLAESRWGELEEFFRDACSAVYGLTKIPALELLLQAGASALKTKSCEEFLSSSCPTCQPLWQSFIESIPVPNHIRSYLICPISGQLMAEDDPPLVGPEGDVFSTSALKSLADQSLEGLVECPRSGRKLPLDRFQRLYVL